jgi:hypothetical protein
MFRTTQDVVELRHWAESRGARPCRDEATGRLGLVIPGHACPATQEVGWDELESTFMVSRSVFVYEDAPGGHRWFIGSSDEAHAFLGRLRGGEARA